MIAIKSLLYHRNNIHSTLPHSLIYAFVLPYLFSWLSYVSCTHYEIVHKLSTSDNIYLLLYGTFCHQIKSSYKVNMYYPAVISEMKLHFNKNSPDIRLRNILDACFKFKTFGHYLQFCQTIRVYLVNCQLENFLDVLIELYPLKSVFSNLFKLVQNLISMPIVLSTAHCEQLFSAC